MKSQSVWVLYGIIVSGVVLFAINTIVIDRRLSYTRMSGLQRLADAILYAIVSVLLVVYYGVLGGLLAILIVSIGRVVVGRSSFIRRQTQRVYRRYESLLMKTTKGWHWLEWVGHSEVSDAPAISSQTELRDIVTHSKLLTAREQRRFDTLFDKPAVVSDMMIPVERIVSVSIDEALGPLVLDELHSSGYRQFPVIDGDINHIKGILYLDDIVDLRSSKASVRDALDPRLEYATPDEKLDHVIARCLTTRRSVVIVRGDDHATLGMLTLRDMVSPLIQ